MAQETQTGLCINLEGWDGDGDGRREVQKGGDICIPKWQPTPVFLPGESHGRRSLVGYRPRGGRVRHD